LTFWRYYFWSKQRVKIVTHFENEAYSHSTWYTAQSHASRNCLFMTCLYWPHLSKHQFVGCFCVAMCLQWMRSCKLINICLLIKLSLLGMQQITVLYWTQSVGVYLLLGLMYLCTANTFYVLLLTQTEENTWNENIICRENLCI